MGTKRINSQRKGARGEREAVERWKKLCPTAYREISTQARSGRAGAPDVKGVPGWWIEVKRAKKFRKGQIETFWDQAHSCAKDGELVVVDYREDHSIPMVYTPPTHFTWDEFEKFYKSREDK